MPEPTNRAEIRKLAAAVDEALVEELRTSSRSNDPTVPSWADGARIGTTPPVAQPGRPPMSQRAVDLNTTLISTSVVIAALGGAGSAILWASGHANPVVIAWVCGCVVAVPVVFALPILAFKSVMKSAKEAVEAAPAEVHNHFNSTVHQEQRNVTNHVRGFGRSNTSI